MLRAVFTLVLLSIVCSECSREAPAGAVLVRWRLVDAVRGAGASLVTCKAAVTDPGACCARVTSQRCGDHDVTIDKLTLRAQRVVSSAPCPVAAAGADLVDVECTSCSSFPCNPAEHTTAFVLPPGCYKLTLVPLRCGVPVGDVPPAQERQVTSGQITNLNAIEIRIDPETQSALYCDTGAGTDFGATCTLPDAGASD